jgi:TonB family protein
MPRIMGAIAAAIVLHAVLLVLRPGVAGSRVSTPPASVLAVRMLQAPAVVGVIQPHAEPSTARAAEPTPARDESPATKPKATDTAALSADRKAEKSEPRPTAREVPQAEPSDPSQPTLAAAPDYAFGLHLDPGPRPIDEIDPDYPDAVNLRTGTVVLRLLISDTGHVDDVAVVRAEPVGVFEKAAIEAFAKARFAPGMAGGRPVKSQIRVEVQFMPINRGGRISGRSY